MMTAKILLAPLLLLLTLLTGVCPRRPREIYVKAGEMVALKCPHYRGYNHGEAKLIWTSHTTQKMDLTNDTSSAEQRQMGVLVHGRSLVIFSASVNHQGNYSCSLRNASRQFWFKLTVYTTRTREHEDRTTYSMTCYTKESCRLSCPDVNIPAANTPNITSNGIIWHKEGDSLPQANFFSSVKESDHGVYSCTRSYLYHGQIYNMTFTVVLNVEPNKKLEKPAVITTPRMSDVFYVDLGSTVVIDCKAVMTSDYDEVFWLSGGSFVERNESLPVFYNNTREYNTEEIKMTASLVFTKVSKDDLSKNYTCKLESISGPSSFVTITLAQKATQDGKSYDAFLVCYKSDTDAGLREDNRKWLKRVLEERFGYSVCLYDRDVSPGEAAAEAVLDCIEQSRTVVLVPTSSHLCPGSDLQKDILAAHVRRKTRLVFIKTETTAVSRSSSLPEALQLLGKAGDCVTWKGKCFMPPSSSFWKQLCYHLSASQHAPKTRLLLQTATQDDKY